MKNINCIIIDPDPQSLSHLEGLIGKFNFLNLYGKYTNAYEAFSAIKTQSLDLIFIDVDHDDIDSIEIVKSRREKSHVILLAETSDYALKAFELGIDNYLLKPVSLKDFLQAVNNIFDRINEETYNAIQHSYPQQYQKKDYIFIRARYRMKKLRFNDILYIQGLSNYLIIKTEGDSMFTLQSFDDLMKKLPEDDFVRIHRSYVVSIDKIDSFHKNTVEIQGNQIPVGETYKLIFQEHLKKLNLLC